MRPGLFIKLAVLLVPLLVPGLAVAQTGRVQPLDRLLPQIRRSHPGEFYDADGPTPGPGGSQHYHLKWMTPDGRILWLDADARTGRVLSEAPGRDMFDGPPGGDRGYGPRGNFRPRDDYDDRPGDDDWRARGPYDGHDAGSYQDRRFDGRQYEGPPRGGRQFEGRQFGGRQSGGQRGWGRGHNGR